MPFVSIRTSARSELVDITADVRKLIPHDMDYGLCHVFCMHTTAGLTVNENADPDVRHDIIARLDDCIPWNSSLYRHMEGNSAAHIKASLMGFSQTLPVENADLVLGTWQCLYFCEFDGPRNRKVLVQFFKDGKKT